MNLNRTQWKAVAAELREQSKPLRAVNRVEHVGGVHLLKDNCGDTIAILGDETWEAIQALAKENEVAK